VGAPVSPARLAWALCGVAAGLNAAAFTLLALNGDARPANVAEAVWLELLSSLSYLAFTGVGALIAARRPENPIGWLLCGAGIAAALEDVLLGYATRALVADPGSLPGGALAGLAADLLWLPTLSVTVTMLLLLFPTGRPPSRRWWPLVWLTVANSAVYVVGAALAPGPLYFFPGERNPLGIEDPHALLRLAVEAPGALVMPGGVLAVVALAMRFRRSRGEERQQLKWLLLAGGLLVAFAPVGVALGEDGPQVTGVPVADAVFPVLVSCLPVALGIAILRHRLYDIDVVIRRTLVYGALTATLLGAYLATVLLLGLALGGSDLAVAGATLAVAALVRPARVRIQAAVDRRFYRSRYDAARAVEALAARLRDDVAVEAVSRDLRAVVRETVAPAHVSLWLRP